MYQIKAPSIYALGYSGLNVTMAIIDTGIMTTHPEFAGRMLTGFNAINNTTNANDDNGHGTHVAGISGAARDGTGMFGVAYNAFLLPIKVLDSSGSGSWDTVARGIQYAVDQRQLYLPTTNAKYAPFVINLSLGGSSTPTTVATSLRNAVSAGMVVAAAAGNDGGANPIYPARYAKETWANGQIIAVGAVDANNVIASFSNRAGDTMAYYLVAPGVSIYSTYTTLNRKTQKYVAGYATLSGTSMATPYVTGAVALIKSGWSYLDAPTIANILFTSAKDLGAVGTDAIYGRGLLDLQAALDPIGKVVVPTAGGTTTPLTTTTSLSSSGAMATALRSAGRAGQLQFAAFDSFARNYDVDLAPALSRKSSSTDGIAAMLAAVDAADQRVVSRQGLVLRASYQGEETRLALGPSNDNGWSRDGGFRLSTTDTAQREVVFGTSGMAASAFGLAGELARLDQAPLAATLSNPYFTLAQQHLHAGVGWPVGDGLRVKFGMLASAPQTGTAEAASRRSPLGQSMLLAELAGRRDALLWSLGFGQLRENHSVLGTTQTGALAMAGQARTHVINFGLALPVSSQATFALQYSMGSTGAVQNQAASIVTGYSDIRSNAFSATLALAQAFRAGDQFSVTLGQPMRVQSGSMGMAMSVGIDADGTPVMGSRAISLRPSGRESRADILYLSPLDRHAKWFLGISSRNQPDHDRAATRETIIGAGIRATF